MHGNVLCVVVDKTMNEWMNEDEIDVVVCEVEKERERERKWMFK